MHPELRTARRPLLRLAAMTLLAPLLLALTHGAEVISSSKDFQLVRSISMPGVVVSGTAVGDTYFASSWQSGLYSYDISDPDDPVPLGHLGPDALLVQNSENENLATNGEILLLSRINGGGDLNRLFVIDVRDPANMSILAEVPGGGSHTMTCLYDCEWAYGSRFGTVVDLREPSEPKLVDMDWTDVIGNVSVHDVTEVRPGLVVTASTPMFALDVTDPTQPRVLAQTDADAPRTVGHGNIWPRGGKDRFLVTSSEGMNNGRCEMYGDNGKTLQIWRADGWQGRGFAPVGTYTLENGDGSDGQPPLSFGVQGCSAHWADEHPSFRNGGLVAMAAFGHGVRLLDVSSQGEPREVAYFLKDLQASIDLEWITDRLLYVVEDGEGGGIDIIEYTGPLPEKAGPLSSS